MLIFLLIQIMGLEKNRNHKQKTGSSKRVGTKTDNKPKFVQSRLLFSNKDSNKVIKCTKCGMAYLNHLNEDVMMHNKFHDSRINGRKWSNNWGQNVHWEENSSYGLLSTPSLSQNDCLSNGERIVMIRPDHSAEVNATLEIMDVVNNELNAPHDENSFWSEGNNAGKAFVYVKNGRAVGVVTIEILGKDRGRWMIHKNKVIVEKARPQFILGISRIWVCKSQRLNGIATKLLNAARQNTIPGKIVDKQFVAWSQPSDNGGKMALRYNSVKHNSGEILIPCYI